MAKKREHETALKPRTPTRFETMGRTSLFPPRCREETETKPNESFRGAAKAAYLGLGAFKSLKMRFASSRVSFEPMSNHRPGTRQV